MKKKVNPHIAIDSINAIKMFDYDFLDKQSMIMHIPHGSNFIPFYDGFILPVDKIKEEMNLVTDRAIQEIFNMPEITTIMADFNRVFCDVERLPDAEEPLFKHGRGFYYTHTDSGEELRRNDPFLKHKIFNEYYLKHHLKLTELVEQKLYEHNNAVIIDCHSFNNTPLKTDENQSQHRPDICLGTNPYHTTDEMVEYFKSKFEGYGYHVKVNDPYEGTIIPKYFYHKDKKVRSIMIEINKRLYLADNHQETLNNIKNLNVVIKNIFNQ